MNETSVKLKYIFSKFEAEQNKKTTYPLISTLLWKLHSAAKLQLDPYYLFYNHKKNQFHSCDVAMLI